MSSMIACGWSFWSYMVGAVVATVILSVVHTLDKYGGRK